MYVSWLGTDGISYIQFIQLLNDTIKYESNMFELLYFYNPLASYFTF